MEKDKLICHLGKTTFKVVYINKFKIEKGKSGYQKTTKYPGFIIPISGTAEFIFDATRYTVSKGNVLHGSINTDIYKKVKGNSDWEYLLILYEIFNQPDAMDLNQEHFMLKTGSDRDINDLINQILNLNSNKDDLSLFEVDIVFRMMLKEFVTHADINKVNVDKDIFYKAIEYIKENYMNDFTVANLANFVDVSENKLLTLFKENIGMSVKDYIINYRIDIACELLASTNMQVNEISAKISYLDPLYFSRIFKKKTGVSPIKYRK